MQSSSRPLGPAVFTVHGLYSCPQQPCLDPDVLSPEPSASATSATRGQISYRKNTRQRLNHKTSTLLPLCLGLAGLSLVWSKGVDHTLEQMSSHTCGKSPKFPSVT